MVVGWGLPSLLRSKGVSTEALFSSLTIATAVQAPATLLGGWLGDRMGRRYDCLVSRPALASPPVPCPNLTPLTTPTHPPPPQKK